jgi:hypothetical protein
MLTAFVPPETVYKITSPPMIIFVVGRFHPSITERMIEGA